MVPIMAEYTSLFMQWYCWNSCTYIWIWFFLHDCNGERNKVDVNHEEMLLPRSERILKLRYLLNKNILFEKCTNSWDSIMTNMSLPKLHLWTINFNYSVLMIVVMCYNITSIHAHGMVLNVCGVYILFLCLHAILQ